MSVKRNKMKRGENADFIERINIEGFSTIEDLKQYIEIVLDFTETLQIQARSTNNIILYAETNSVIREFTFLRGKLEPFISIVPIMKPEEDAYIGVA